jgi:hypothetical protein
MQSGASPHLVVAAPEDGRTPLNSPLPSLIPYPEAALFLCLPATFCHTRGVLLDTSRCLDRRPSPTFSHCDRTRSIASRRHRRNRVWFA